MKVYVATDNKGYISAYHTSAEYTAFEEAEQENPTIDISKLQGYKIQDGKLVFDDELYATYIAEQEKAAAVEDGKELMEQLVNEKVLVAASDAEAYTMRYLYPEWHADSVEYKKNDRMMYNNKFYKVLQDHTSQESLTPDTASSLFVEISDPNEEWPEFKQPSGAHDAYMKDDKVTYNGKHYVSLIDNNTWSPETYPAGWHLAE